MRLSSGGMGHARQWCEHSFAVAASHFTVRIASGSHPYCGVGLWCPSSNDYFCCLRADGIVQMDSHRHLRYAENDSRWRTLQPNQSLTVTMRCDTIQNTVGFIVEGINFGVAI